MELTIVGHWGGYPKQNEASTGYLLTHEGYHLLIDCGSAVLSQLQNYIQPEMVDAVIISHYHPDHIADIGVLQHALLINKFLGKNNRNLSIYGHTEDDQAFRGLSFRDVTKGEAYDPSQSIKIGPFTIKFLKTIHPVPCYAMCIEAGGKKLVYTADSSFQESFIPFSEKADVLLCECNFYGEMDGSSAGHMNSRDAGNIAEKADVSKLILTHLPQFGDLTQLVDEASEIFSGEVMLAAAGLKITI
ncbi:MBL fold metallo-hydrolase [Falsibacillus pallidus]|uniref:Ribonuclease BN (tRNA processing enzyme) n=1 Tax=Falsibacillus pallidus TaxID=493781 RepID=A0A370GVZ8_9BACI|nr:MBL fold metallo-hydrolase [Falsibacillus pallidus]RDI47848.1 ribonuclease BN (tRNA processing enzyme) [Falsibacillus pallidus]